MSDEHDQPAPNAPRMFPALKVMERQCPPLHRGRPPYWRAPVTPPSSDFYCPSWNWVSPHDFPEGAEVTILDANGAYLGAAGGCYIAHSHLTHTGPINHHPRPREVAPGYYRITVPHWAFPGTIVSPLGDSSRVQTESTLWIAAPTLILLLELEEDGHLGGLTIIDSWTAAVRADFRSWVDRLKSLRTECLDRIDTCQTDAARAAATARYTSFKEGYSAAFSLMLTGDKCQTRRPDWAHTVYAQHAASQWRKAWRYTYTGAPIVSMGHVDEIAVLAKDLPDVLALVKPPFRFDPTGRQIGAMKPKQTTQVAPQPYEEALASAEEMEDIL